MQLLIIGYSSLARRRLIPAVLQSAGFSKIDVASRSKPSDVILPDSKRGDVFADYEKALNKSCASVVWISLVNSAHAEWTERALLSGRHVVVDKPSFLTLTDAERLTNLALKNRLLLAEATVWPFHPQIGLIKETMRQNGSPNRASAVFSFPPFPSGDFRYKKILGGGILNDLGPYAVSVNRIVFGLPPQTMMCRITSQGDDVETGFECRFERNGWIVNGVFGFGARYENRLMVQGDGWTVSLEPAFTSPPGKLGRITEKTEEMERILPAPDGDAFTAFLDAVTEAVRNRSYESFEQKLMDDAEALDALRQSAERG
jgi:dTDP-3,4-didehydro-2,6-dideoxy-alpha-D-glucose 3-reductase